ALEGRAFQEVDRVPANALAAETSLQRALTDVVSAAKAARRLDETGDRIVGAAARKGGRTGPKPADIPRIEAEADVAAGRRRDRGSQQYGGQRCGHQETCKSESSLHH